MRGRPPSAPAERSSTNVIYFEPGFPKREPSALTRVGGISPPFLKLRVGSESDQEDRSQRFKSKDVEIFRRGKEIVLREKEGDLAGAFDLLASLPHDLGLAGRKDDPPQKRKDL
jgi:antitoxin VapB